MTPPPSIGRLLEGLRVSERVITFLAFCVLVLIVFADVAFREITGSGLHWARQVGVYANIFVVMLGFGLASSEAAHLRPRFADSWIPARFERFMPHVQEGVMALFCLVVSAVAVAVVIETFQLQERSVVLRLLVWPVQAVIPLAFLIAAVRHGCYAIWPTLAPKPPSRVEEAAAGAPSLPPEIEPGRGGRD
ncbi:MAG: TRAP transporter small permease [Gammaproteobacteria bacterium]|nr:TRAP transporter small permease [Gammaproteobacteria bacterium]TVQ48773.1 MAG: TRAP transporter small permease [Gammaproteobacteria bacterium]